MIISEATKPTARITAMLDHLVTAGKRQKLAAGTILEFRSHGEALCHGIYSGVVALHRKSDNMALAVINGPFISGISNSLSDMGPGPLYLKVKTPVNAFSLSAAQALKVIEKQNQWENLCRILSYYTAFFYNRINEIAQPDSYKIVRALLLRLEQEPYEIRSYTTACQYIQDHSALSRSGIMLILADLKKGGFINIHRGILVSINKIPENY